jgi:thiosulfate/3-mercaptopyruvate sulfurtransferase
MNMTETSTVVTIDWLQAHYQDPQVVVVDCRFSLLEPALGQQQYQAGHIPGADYLDLNRDLSSPVRPHGGRHPLPAIAPLVDRLGQMGITPATQVVAYDASRFAFAARLWWLLRYLGHDRVAVLDGGWPAWQAAGYPVTTAVPQRVATSFIPQLRSAWVVDMAAVKARAPEVILIDAREAERYRGEREPIDPVAGHIPGAVNYPWPDLTTAAGYVTSVTTQRERWATLPADAEIMVYCGSGVTACVDLLALAIAGRPPGQLYAGSWSDWCSYL